MSERRQLDNQNPGAAFSKKHITSLDGLRGLAVLAVVAFHLAIYAPANGGVGGALFSIVRFGWVGVDLFFVLSGFLITGILYDNRHGQTRLRGFYGRRILRIAPLYYVVLLLFAVGALLVASSEQAESLFQALPWHGLYLTNIRITLAGAWAAAPLHTGHLWSLAVEEQFYLLWPAVIAVAVRWTRSPRVALMWICSALILSSIAFRLWMLPGSTLGAYTMLPARMDALSVGAFVALWVRGPEGWKPVVASTRPILLVCGSALVLLALLSGGSHSYLHPLQQGAGYTLWAVVFGAILVRAASAPASLLSRTLSTRPLVETGKISYGLYLIHFPIMFVLDSLGVPEQGVIVFAILTVVISFGLSILSWHLMESRLVRLKVHFPYDGDSQRRSQLVPESVSTNST